ncbi:MAG: 4-hydroxythreonine-4-phosphate dehydrogenase PdxA [Synechococcales bacterium]|nr:4-hydroxythreonine-4-phosphate dehydrogenase PdxA [Synechococcales bacterium]
MTVAKAKLILPLGDPAGIGAEVILKALLDPGIRSQAEITLAGNRALLHDLLQTMKATPTEATHLAETDLADPDAFPWLEIPIPADVASQVQPGGGNAASGEVSFRSLEQAIAATVAGEFEGIVTAPIAKSAWKAAGHDYPGQTELLAERAGVSKFGMTFLARSPHTGWILRALLATTHIPLRQVPDRLSSQGLTEKIELLIDCLQQDFGITQPTIAIAGLNPHSGEQGQLGREEVDWLEAWLAQMRSQFPQVKFQGLLPPDTMWVKPGQAWFGQGQQALQRSQTVPDAFLALYHDQGLIPVKLMAFDRAVNTTIGLPFVRTSPDHGTAFDIAGQGIADATSMKEAILWAAQLVQQRRQSLHSVNERSMHFER